MPIARLKEIPPEIWHEILCHACTDGGRTGRVLALTCRFFRDQSLNVRFHSLYFEKTSRVVAFLISLQMQPKECKPVIHHIHFTPTLYTGHIQQSLRHLIARYQPDTPGILPSLSASLTTALFSVATRTLRTLCLFPSDAEDGAPLRPFTQPFPNLEELSVWNHPLFQFSGHAPVALVSSGAHVDVSDTSGSGSERHDRYLFPALKRAHIVLGDASMPANHLLRRLSTFVSSGLTHLRLSAVTYVDDEVPQILAQLVGVPVPVPLYVRLQMGLDGTGSTRSGAVVPREDAPFPHLRYIAIHAIQPKHDIADPGAFSRWASFLGLLRELERTCRRVKGMSMIVLERSWMRQPCWKLRLHEEWLQRMQGGRGCWVESVAEESEMEGTIYAPKDIEDVWE